VRKVHEVGSGKSEVGTNRGLEITSDLRLPASLRRASSQC
jgi:hypothetical protein